MFRLTQNTLKGVFSSRPFSSSSLDPTLKLTIVGSDIIGEQLSVLMKTNPLVSTLSLFNSGGNPAYLEYLPYPAEVKRYDGYDELKAALTKSDMVIITGHPRKPGMTRDEFAINASVVKDLCEAISVYCPKALVNMINNDVNSIVPIAAEVFKKAGTYDPKRLFGVTTSNVVRAQALYAKKAGIDKEVLVPVVGGHDGITILPLFSQATLQANLSEEDIKFLTSTTQYGGTEFVRKGSATLSMAAVAGAIFADACLKGLNGVPDIVECTYVQSDVTDLPFFASKVRLGKNGVEEIMGLGSLSDYEKASLENLLPELKQSIDKGIEFVKKL